jgi:hypothetical protein
MHAAQQRDGGVCKQQQVRDELTQGHLFTESNCMLPSSTIQNLQHGVVTWFPTT